MYSVVSENSWAASAAENALRYYKLVGYTLVGFFAATAVSGYDYPIVSNGTELFPAL